MPVVESIGVAALGWVASPLVAKLLNEGFDSLGIDAEEKLQKLRASVLPVLKSVIEKAEGSPHRSEVEGWLQRLKDAYDGAEDALDRLNYDRLRRKAKAAARSSSGKRPTNPVRSSSVFRIPKPVKWVKKGGRDMLSPEKIKLKRRLNKLEKIAGEAKELSTLLGAQPETAESRQTISVPPPEVFGRDEKCDEIIWRLKREVAAIREPGSSSGVPIIAIVGRPGVGKTTLAQYVREQLGSESSHFHPIMWVHASRNLNAAEIMKDIIQQASLAGEPQEDLGDPDVAVLLSNLDAVVAGNLSSPEALRLKMNKKLNAKKFLLVIDDVWCHTEDDEKNWDTLFRCLSKCCCLPGSKILVTSQSDDAPRKIAAACGAAVKPILQLEELEENYFLDLFIHYALPSREINSRLREELEEKCKTIAKKLNKDPTAAKMVGETIATELADLLRSQGDWRTYLETIAQKDWSGATTKALMWSYQHLPAHLQRCFSYCSLYPRGHEFKARELVQLWMAQGFIKPDDQNETMEDAGNGYLEKLVSRFYIQFHNRDSHSFGTGKRGGYYTLHELLYDLAVKVTSSDCVRIEGNRQSEIPSTIRHLCIPADRLNENKKSICKLKKLRTLIVTKGESVVSDENVVTDIFKRLRKLRVLLVLGLNLEKLAKFNSEMKHLRILQLSGGTSEFVLPELVSTLYQLQVLEVENASSLPARLPPRLQKITIIRSPFLTFVTNEDLQLSQDDKRSIREVMRNRTQEWFRHQYKEDLVRNEREMRNFIATMNGREHNNSVPAADADIAAVWGRWLETYERKTELIYSRQNEAKLHLPSTITRLWLEGCNMTDHALSVCLQNLPSLTQLLLADLKMITRLPSADVLANLISLQTLRLSDCWALTSLGGIGSLPCLRKLFLIGCPCLDIKTAVLPPSLQSIFFDSCADADVILANANLPHLSHLTISRFHKQTASLQFGNLRSLQSLTVEHCSGLSSLVDLRELHSLKLLILESCPKLQSVAKVPRSLKRIVIYKCPLLEG
ncbi:putative disease resistance protein At3g14460 [Ananas comosus]|uniref:Disease resistance protein At3g14460 n=1 Tax=Ananas comosus TaxID=4615 RepID=A0A6P5FMY5_ANACO|nr:putative disease resistance protein At3g14460 [Ananas comosus]